MASTLADPPASAKARRVPDADPDPKSIPPLEAGDRLCRDEFERRYHAMADLKKAELIEGIVYMPSPVRISHAQPHGDVATWLGFYASQTNGTQRLSDATSRLDGDNEPQPDAMLRILPERGGQSRDSADGYVEGAPELAVEIAASSVAYDLHVKKNAYRRNGVCEYLVLLVREAQVIWWSLEGGEYAAIEPEDGVLAIGSGAPYAIAAARALLAHTEMSAAAIAREALLIAARICLYTNDQIIVEEV